jgi:hypothetical protein
VVSRICQTSTATPAEPGDLLSALGKRVATGHMSRTQTVTGFVVAHTKYYSGCIRITDRGESVKHSVGEQ